MHIFILDLAQTWINIISHSQKVWVTQSTVSLLLDFSTNSFDKLVFSEVVCLTWDYLLNVWAVAWSHKAYSLRLNLRESKESHLN